MVWSNHVARLCASCLLLVNRIVALTADDAPPVRAMQTAIGAQPLTQALAAFTASTHLQLVYVSQLALGKVSQAVPGGLPAPASLALLLEGTGLEFLYLNDRTIKLSERPNAARLRAQAPADGSSPVSTASPDAKSISSRSIRTMSRIESRVSMSTPSGGK